MENRTERQLEIIETAGKILTEDGVHGLTTKKLANRVGFSESAIYRHFKSKEDIIVSLLLHLSESMDERFIDLELSEDDPVYNFETLFKSQLNFFSEQPHYVVAVFSDGLLEESDRVNEAIETIMQTKMKHLMPIITSGKQKQVFTNTISTQDLMSIVMGTFRLQMYKWRLSGFEFDIVLRGSNTIQSLLTLIKK
jgi:AcrR family transcriptional regulator